jgi:ABC-2 type transport system ATP-binding protein
LEVHVASPDDLARAMDTVTGVAPQVSTDHDAVSLQIPMANSADQSMQVLRSLDEAGVEIRDFQLRKPTLDDVFLALTTTEDRP